MSARAASSALILSLLIAPGLFRAAHAGPWLPAPGEYYTELCGGVFSAYTYHDADGNRTDLGGNREERSLRGSVELGWKKRVSFVMSAPVISATQTDGMGGSTSSTGLEDLLVGFRYGIRTGPSALAVELDWRAPLGYSRTMSLFADSLHGGGLHGLSLSLLYGAPLTKRGFLQAAAGYENRYTTFPPQSSKPEDPSASSDEWIKSFLASADVGVWMSRSLLLCGRYSGSMCLSHGLLYPDRTVHLVGPSLVWRVDDRLDLTAGCWSTAAAKNALHYDQVYVAVAFKQTKLNRLQGFLGGTKAP